MAWVTGAVLSDGGLVRGAGVSWDKEAGQWEASIDLEEETIRLGLFQDEHRVSGRATPGGDPASPDRILPVQAALAYDAAARGLHGDDAEVNFKTPADVPDKAPMLPLIGARKKGGTSSDYLGGVGLRHGEVTFMLPCMCHHWMLSTRRERGYVLLTCCPVQACPRRRTNGRRSSGALPASQS
jgi:hypothetical protein